MSDDVIEQATDVINRARWEGREPVFSHRIAQALADAGLLPTEAEWGVRYPRRDNELHRGPWSKEEAESWIQEGIDDGVLPGAFILVSRRTTPWKDAS